MRLSPDRFRAVVEDTVLVALDLVVRNSAGDVLVGRRQNAPAKGFLFVPGGRVFKGETLESALPRISKDEIGYELQRADVQLLGVFDHIYPDNVFGDPAFGTHYVVIGCSATLPEGAIVETSSQHDAFVFLTVAELKRRDDVHPFTRNYFEEHPTNRFLPFIG